MDGGWRPWITRRSSSSSRGRTNRLTGRAVRHVVVVLNGAGPTQGSRRRRPVKQPGGGSQKGGGVSGSGSSVWRPSSAGSGCHPTTTTTPSLRPGELDQKMADRDPPPASRGWRGGHFMTRRTAPHHHSQSHGWCGGSGGGGGG